MNIYNSQTKTLQNQEAKMDNSVAKSLMSLLELVYTPISNQEAVWLQKDPDVKAMLRSSDFYMIGARAEGKFTDITTNSDTHVVRFNLSIGDHICDSVALHLQELPGIADHDFYYLETGPKLIRAWDGPVNKEGSKVLNWFTTEKLLFDKAHGMPGIEGLDCCRDLATYDLLYVGIAKTGDSFTRLIKNGHTARMNILSNESQRHPGARVADEIYLFMFRVNPLIIKTFGSDHEFSEEDFSEEPARKRIVADAEKAFVNLLQPEYNVIKFDNYPDGVDGLSGTGYNRYAYQINESIAFNTAHGKIKGSHNSKGFISNDADFIFVEGDKVSFYISGVDFPSTPGGNVKE